MIKLNNLNLKNISEEFLDTFIEAGKVARDISHRGVKITVKADKSPVTDGDLAVNQLLTEKIENLTPNIPIISEETVNLGTINKNKTFWLIDPIDGTREYIKKRDEYTLNVSLIINLKLFFFYYKFRKRNLYHKRKIVCSFLVLKLYQLQVLN